LSDGDKDGRPKPEDREQRPEDGSQRTEDRGRRPGDRGQRPSREYGVRRRTTEGKRVRKPAVGGQWAKI